MKNAGALSNLKLRIGWGMTGNQEIPDKISLISVGTEANANWFVNGAFLPGITFTRTPNPDIQWETTQQTNLGVDFGFIQNRLSGTIDLFSKKTVDVLLEIPAKAPAPTRTQWLNVPDLEIINNGVELGLNGAIISKENLTWDMGINFTYIKNEVKNLPVKYIETGSASGQGLSETRVQVITNGQPIGTFYGMVFQGFDNDGYSVYKTGSDGNEVKEFIGSALPDFTYSLNSKLTYKNFDLSMFWYGSKGNKVYNNTANAIFTKTPLNNGNNVTKNDTRFYDDRIKSETGFNQGFLVGQQYGPDGTALEQRNGEPLIFVPEIDITSSPENAGIRAIKFAPDPNAIDQFRSPNDVPVLRISDIYLVRAEAKLRSGDEAGALADVNYIRSRRSMAGETLPLLNSITLDDILKERGYELYWEGFRRQDLIRFGKFTGAYQEKEVTDAYRTIFPVPTSAADVNENIDPELGNK